jgi:hypothetical protein
MIRDPPPDTVPRDVAGYTMRKNMSLAFCRRGR